MKLALLLAMGAAVAAPAPKPEAKLVLKAGEAMAFPARLEDGKIVLGPARRGAFGKLEPGPGEIAVGLSPRDKELYDHLVVTEKTAAPVNFVATGLVGEIKIDERVVTGKLNAPVEQRIGGTSWTVWLHAFEAGK